jgi:hypothetical protein
MSRAEAEKEKARLEEEMAWDLKIAQAVRCRVRYFRDGAVLGSRKFVNDFFASQRERFGAKRKDGARKARGALKPLAGEIWSLRDLRDGEG